MASGLIRWTALHRESDDSVVRPWGHSELVWRSWEWWFPPRLWSTSGSLLESGLGNAEADLRSAGGRRLNHSRPCERAARRCRGTDNTLLDIPSQMLSWHTVADKPGLASLRRSTLKCRIESRKREAWGRDCTEKEWKKLGLTWGSETQAVLCREIQRGSHGCNESWKTRAGLSFPARCTAS